MGYDQAPAPILCPTPPAVPQKVGRSPSLVGDLETQRRPAEVATGEDVPPPIPLRPERRASTNPGHMDGLPTTPVSSQRPDSLPQPTASPPPPSIPPPQLPDTVATPTQAAEKLSGELTSQGNCKPKQPPPVPLRPKSRKGGLPVSPETNEV